MVKDCELHYKDSTEIKRFQELRLRNSSLFGGTFTFLQKDVFGAKYRHRFYKNHRGYAKTADHLKTRPANA